jgi:hypothetical protein
MRGATALGRKHLLRDGLVYWRLYSLPGLHHEVCCCYCGSGEGLLRQGELYVRAM